MKKPLRRRGPVTARGISCDNANVDVSFDSGSSDSGLDVIDNNSVSSPWENSDACVSDADTAFSTPPKFKVPRLNISEPPTATLLSTGCNSFVVFDHPQQLPTTKEESNCQELARLQSVLRELLKNKPNASESAITELVGSVSTGYSVCVDTDKSKNLTLSVSSNPATNSSPSNNAVKTTASTVSRKRSSHVLVQNQPDRQNKFHSLYEGHKSKSSNGSVELRILSEPEEQHRARYMTEGSRGAVKDRCGSGFPVVKLTGYNKPATLQIFIGNDQGKVMPHLFYQASKACGKSSPTYKQRRMEGTVVIETELLPEKDMTESCDCVGILKERNVDVEHRLQQIGATKMSKKRSPRCRLIFRVCILINGHSEILQVASSPILCTQPPGVPEISLCSLKKCSAAGGEELFIIGKNFLKDTKIIFRDIPCNKSERNGSLGKGWEVVVSPERDFLQNIHLVCKVPAYRNHESLIAPKKVEFVVQSSGKRSEPQCLTFYPQQNCSVFGIDNGPIVNQMNGSMPTVIQIPNLVQKEDAQQSQTLSGPIFVVLPASNGSAIQATNNVVCNWKNNSDSNNSKPAEAQLAMMVLQPAAGTVKQESNSPPEQTEILQDVANSMQINSSSSMTEIANIPLVSTSPELNVFQPSPKRNSISSNLSEPAETFCNPEQNYGLGITDTQQKEPVIFSQIESTLSSCSRNESRSMAIISDSNIMNTSVSSAPETYAEPMISAQSLFSQASSGLVAPTISTLLNISAENENKSETFQQFNTEATFGKPRDKCSFQEIQLVINRGQQMLNEMIRQENSSQQIINEIIRQETDQMQGIENQNLVLADVKNDEALKPFDTGSIFVQSIVDSGAAQSVYERKCEASQIQIINEIIRQETQEAEFGKETTFGQILDKQEQRCIMNEMMRPEGLRSMDEVDNSQTLMPESEFKVYKTDLESIDDGSKSQLILKGLLMNQHRGIEDMQTDGLRALKCERENIEEFSANCTLDKAFDKCSAKQEQRIIDDLMRHNNGSSHQSIISDATMNSKVQNGVMLSGNMLSIASQQQQLAQNLMQNSSNKVIGETNFVVTKDLNMSNSTLEEMMRIPDAELLNLITNNAF